MGSFLSPAVLSYSRRWHRVRFRRTKWWFDTCVYSEMISTVRLVNTPFNNFAVVTVRTFDISFRNNFQVCNTRLTVVTTPYIRSPELTPFVTESWYPLTNVASFSPPPCPWQPPFCSVSLSLACFRFHIQVRSCSIYLFFCLTSLHVAKYLQGSTVLLWMAGFPSFFMAKYCSMAFICRSVFIHASVNGQVVSMSWLFWVTLRGTWGCRWSLQDSRSISFARTHRSRIAGSCWFWFLCKWTHSRTFPFVSFFFWTALCSCSSYWWG